MYKISIKKLIKQFKWRISFTVALVVIESLLSVLFPLFIGLAINDLLEQKYDGIINLALLGLASLVFGSARRFYDTRIYSGIYCQIAPEMVDNELHKNSSTSKISARSSLLTEFIDFLEDSMPTAIGGIIALLGILIIIANLNLNVFWACLTLMLVIILVYLFTGKLNFTLNRKYNNQLEKQVLVIEKKEPALIARHFNSLMLWNIKLSDLETFNYLIIWLAAIALFLYAPITVIEAGVLKYGLVFSVLMYVLDYIENIIMLPLQIQQLIRLKEISVRLSA